MQGIKAHCLMYLATTSEGTMPLAYILREAILLPYFIH